MILAVAALSMASSTLPMSAPPWRRKVTTGIDHGDAVWDAETCGLRLGCR